VAAEDGQNSNTFQITIINKNIFMNRVRAFTLWECFLPLTTEAFVLLPPLKN
jgi:hypothetical protein